MNEIYAGESSGMWIIVIIKYLYINILSYNGMDIGIRSVARSDELTYLCRKS